VFTSLQLPNNINRAESLQAPRLWKARVSVGNTALNVSISPLSL